MITLCQLNELRERMLIVCRFQSTTVTTDRRQFILFAYLRFGSHFRSHDSHVTGEHMGELGAIFCCCFSARASSSSTYKYKYKDTSTVYLK